MSKLKSRAGDYETGKLAERCMVLVGDVIDNWLRLASDRRTVVFWPEDCMKTC